MAPKNTENTGRTRINPKTEEEEDIYEWVPLYRFVPKEKP